MLYYRLGGADVMAGQLARLAESAALPSVALGVIPFAAPDRAAWPYDQQSSSSEHSGVVGGSRTESLPPA